MVRAVNETSFSLQKKESFALLGVNGAGKSTTFKCLAIEEVLSDGKIMIDGRNVRDFYSDPKLL